MLLIIQEFLEGKEDVLKYELAIIGIMWGLSLAAMSLDLAFGWRKAKKRGEARTSYGLRRTVTKGVQYFALLFFMFMFDCIIGFFTLLPVATFFGTLFILFVESKSVFEKAHDKDKRRMSKSLEELVTLLENRDDLIKGISKIVKKESQGNKDIEQEDSFKNIE